MHINGKNYTGNKDISGVREKIVGLIPKDYLFIEGFAGGAGIAKKVHASGVNVLLVEKNPDQAKYLANYFSSSIVVNDCIINYLGYSQFFLNLKKVVFYDPPYIFSTRAAIDLYGNYEMSNQEHICFLKYVSTCNIPAIVIHPIHPLYDKYFFCWKWVDVKIRYNTKTSLERIYTNIPGGIELFDYACSLPSFGKRQEYKRELKNLVSKFGKMSAEKRYAVIAELKNKKLI